MESSEKLLKLNQEFSCPVQDLYEAFTKVECLQKWWEGGELKLDLKPGGGFHYPIDTGEGQPNTFVHGKFLRIAEDELEMTWAWENDKTETSVILRFIEKPGGSEIKIEHDLSNGPNACADGWNWKLDCLRDYLEGETA